MSWRNALLAGLPALLCALPAQAADALPSLHVLGGPVAAAALAPLRGGVASVDSRVAVSVLVRPVTADGNVMPLVGDGVAPLAVYLQNSTDNRQLQVQRVIDVHVDSLQRLQSAAWQRSLLGGVITSLQR